MEVRKYHSGDIKPLARILKLAFGGDESWSRDYFDPGKNVRVDPDQVHLIEEDGEPRATATVLPLEAYVDGEAVPMGGVAAVASDPAYRRRGHAGKLMMAALRDMRGRGVHLSMLYPFNHSFYGRFGYGLAADSILYTIDPRQLPTSGEQRTVRAFTPDDIDGVIKLFGEQASKHQMCVGRGEARWKQMLGANDGKDDEPYTRDSEVAVYERDSRLEGYILYSMTPYQQGREPGREMSVRDFVAATPRAREGLISFLGALDPDTFRVMLPTSYEQRAHPYLPDSHLKASMEPEFMLRLVDVEGALRHLKREIKSPLVLEVSDDIIPENEGEYTVWDGDVKRGAGGDHRVSLDVRKLAQLYAGYLPARQLAERGFIRPGSEEALELLEAYFPVLDPWVFPPDHF